MHQILPQIYGKVLSSSFLNLDVTETKATCQDCLRAKDRRFSFLYQADLKCCTFHPFLPNYAAGALLSPTLNKSLGVDVLKNKIEQRQFAFPLGVMAPYDYQFKFFSKEEEEFGNNATLLCPYFDKQQNQCSIWEYRGVVCTTFYCRSDYGQNGQKFWAVLSDFLSYTEMALAEECLVQLDFSPRQISDQLMYLNKHDFTSEETTQVILDKKTDRALWNLYEDKFDFYQKCTNIVRNLSRKQFLEIIGEQGAELEEEVLDYANRR